MERLIENMVGEEEWDSGESAALNSPGVSSSSVLFVLSHAIDRGEAR